MKKLLCTLAVLVLLVGTLVVMSACGGADTTAEATTTAPVTTVPVIEAPIPDDYTLYDNGDISFAYPESWAKTDGSTVLLQDAVTGNHITVV